MVLYIDISIVIQKPYLSNVTAVQTVEQCIQCAQLDIPKVSVYYGQINFDLLKRSFLPDDG